MTPQAVMEVRGDGFVRVCAYCPDKVAADAWVADRGLQATRSICRECAPLVASEVIFDAGVRRAAPLSGLPEIAARVTALSEPSRIVAFSCRMGSRRSA
jgi:hypothetical protein